MARVFVLTWMLVAATWCGPAAGAPLQELNAAARHSIAHLSIRDGKGEQVGSGSGFVISDSGRLVTNFHVIDGAENVVAVFPDQREVRVTGAWALDKDADIAILQLERGKYVPLSLAAEPAREGEDIVLIGSPLGLGSSISAGVVSAMREKGLEGTRYGDDGGGSWALQITAVAAPGSSGSPILRTNGEVVGVLVGSLPRLHGASFGIAVSKVQRLLGSAPLQPSELTSATGARSVKTNLMISGAFLLGVVAVWLAGAHLHRRFQARSGPVKR